MSGHWQSFYRVVTVVLYICLSVKITAQAQSQYTLLNDVDRRAIEECRESLADAVNNPSAPGGVSIVTQPLAFSDAERNICLYGSLAGSDIAKLVSRIETMPTVDRLILRSTGGAVEDWLTLSEALQGRVKMAIVDELCFSSCANYAFLIAQYKHVPPDSLVVWHGGPTSEKFFSNQSLTQIERAEIQDLAKRTRTLYEKIGVSVELLEDTGSLKLTAEDESFIKKQMMIDGPDYDIDGFALSPHTLARCYGVKGLDFMWHPNTTLTVYGLGKIRSSSLRVLMRPDTKRINECLGD